MIIVIDSTMTAFLADRFTSGVGEEALDQDGIADLSGYDITISGDGAAEVAGLKIPPASLTLNFDYWANGAALGYEDVTFVGFDTFADGAAIPSDDLAGSAEAPLGFDYWANGGPMSHETLRAVRFDAFAEGGALGDDY